MELSDILSLWHELTRELRSPAILLEIGLIVAALLSSWMLSRWLKPRAVASTPWQKGLGRIIFPALALGLIRASIWQLQGKQTVLLLKFTAALLLGLLLLRSTAAVLRAALPNSKWIKSSERTLIWLVLLGLAMHLTGQMQPFLNALDSIGFRLGKHDITLLLVINVLLTVSLTLLVSMWLGRQLEQRIMQTALLDSSLRVVLAKLGRAMLIVFGVMIALPLIGLDLTLFSVFGGAVGVGLGFGLQKTASNYVSGFIILLDRSIRLGDHISVDKFIGQVTRLTARYLVIKIGDGTEVLVPNETMVTSVVVNHSYTNRQVRVDIPVQVAYETDLDHAKAILLATTTDAPYVLADPAPQALLIAFEEHGIRLNLQVWVEDLAHGSAILKSTLMEQILREFRAAGIRIPHPPYEAIPAAPILPQIKSDAHSDTRPDSAE